MIRNYSDSAPATTLTAPIGSGNAAIPVASTAGYPTPPFTIGFDRGLSSQEVCLIDAVTDAVTFHASVRGFDGTTAVGHSALGTVEHCTVALDFREANLHVWDTTRDDHTQLMRADGARHDLFARHVVGTTVPVGPPAPLTFGQGAVTGNTGLVADAGHQHAMPTPQQSQDVVIPVGTIWALANALSVGGVSMAPPGWILCDGRAIPRSVFPLLWGFIGGYYGAGNGTTTFNVPDFRGKALVGVNLGVITAGNDFSHVGAQGGEYQHTLSVGEMPIHSHQIVDPGHEHQQPPGNAFIVQKSGTAVGCTSDPADFYPGFNVTEWGNTSVSGTGLGLWNNGSSQPHNNVAPYICCWMMIKADSFVPGYG